MRHKTRKYVTIILYISFLVFGYGGLVYQLEKNVDLYEDVQEEINEFAASDISHPVMQFTEKPGSPYVDAYREITRSDATRFWLQADHFCRSMVLNYAMYPNEVLFSVKTQLMMMEQVLALSEEPIIHYPPEDYERIITIEPEPEEQAEEVED